MNLVIASLKYIIKMLKKLNQLIETGEKESIELAITLSNSIEELGIDSAVQLIISQLKAQAENNIKNQGDITLFHLLIAKLCLVGARINDRNSLNLYDDGHIIKESEFFKDYTEWELETFVVKMACGYLEKPEYIVFSFGF